MRYLIGILTLITLVALTYTGCILGPQPEPPDVHEDEDDRDSSESPDCSSGEQDSGVGNWCVVPDEGDCDCDFDAEGDGACDNDGGPPDDYLRDEGSSGTVIPHYEQFNSPFIVQEIEEGDASPDPAADSDDFYNEGSQQDNQNDDDDDDDDDELPGVITR